MSSSALRALAFASVLNAVFTMAYPAAVAAPLVVGNVATALRVLAIASISVAALSTVTMLGLRRWLSLASADNAASTPLVIHAIVSVTSGLAVVVGWMAVRWDALAIDLTWILGLTALGILLLFGAVIGVLELLIARALGGTNPDGYGLLGPLRRAFFVAGVANVVAVAISVTSVVGMVAYGVIAALLALLFLAAWRERVGGIGPTYRYGQRWVVVVVVVSLLAFVIPSAVAVLHTRTLRHDPEEATESASIWPISLSGTVDGSTTWTCPHPVGPGRIWS